MQIRKYFFHGKKLPFDHKVLKSDSLNVMSDEDLTFHDFYHSVQFGKAINHNMFPIQLKKILGDDVEVTILLTTRNQTELIFSSYLQKFKFLKQYLGSFSFSDFLENKTNHLKRNQNQHLALYDFKQLSHHWELTFNSKPHILLYEDLSKDKSFFLSELAKLLSVPSTTLIKLAGNKHHRKRDKSGDFLSTYFVTLSKFGRLIKNVLPVNDFERKLDRRYYMRYSLYIKYEKRVMLKVIKMKVPKPTLEEKKFIEDYFNSSNLEFAKSHNLDLTKMTNYNYIK